jgi:hypothetical protein
MRYVIESEFLPLRCECLEEEGDTLMIRIRNPETDQVDLLRSGIPYERFSSRRAIVNLIDELRRELDHKPLAHAKAS